MPLQLDLSLPLQPSLPEQEDLSLSAIFWSFTPASLREVEAKLLVTSAPE
jgi:hypothetical protein